jgi:hypothetical protein
MTVEQIGGIMKMEKRFYVGSAHLALGGEPYVKRTVEEAIDEASRRCAESGDPQIVVQIIRVVRRASAPVVVENVDPTL